MTETDEILEEMDKDTCEETKECETQEEVTEDDKELETEESTDASEDADTKDASKEADTKQDAKKGLFNKKNKKDKKDEQIEELNDRVKRQMAEFENFRKRTEKEKSQMYDMGAKSIVEKILPVIDNFERGLAAVPEDAKDDPFVDGMNKIYKQMISVLEEAGVKAIEAE